MEWIKAKNIIIVMFAILNLFLFTYSGLYRSNSSTGRETYEKIVSVLDSKGVLFDKDLKVPSAIKDTSLLIMENNLPDENAIVEFFLGLKAGDINPEIDHTTNRKIYNFKDSSVIFYGNGMVQYFNTNTKTSEAGSSVTDYSVGGSVPEKFDEIFSVFGIDENSYVLDSRKTDDIYTTYYYIEKYKGYLIYDNLLKIKLENMKISEVNFFSRKVKGLSRNKSMIISPYHILLKNYYTVSDGLIIRDISFGYKGYDESQDMMQEAEETFLSPAWRVIASDAEEHFFKAYDGERIK